MRPTILITGGAGFIGSNVLLHLFERLPDHRFLVLDALTYAGNPQNIPAAIRDSGRFEFWYGNVNNLTLVDELVKQSTAVLHFAAESHVARSIFDNRIFFDTDVLGSQTIANAVLKHRKTVKRFIHISSSEVYGTAMQEPMDEDHPLMPMSPYAAAKAGADRLVYSYIKTYDLPAVIVRPFNNYGPRQHLEKVVPRFITSCLLEEEMTVHGDGLASRDWLHVSDHAAAMERLVTIDIDRIRGETLNLGTGTAVSVLEIARQIETIMERKGSLITHISDRPGQVSKHISSTAKAQALLGWRATTSLEEGLRQTVAWYQQNRAWWEPLRWMRHVPILTSDGSVEMH
jgi:dTDP-glucose 4,6-dehydratase